MLSSLPGISVAVFLMLGSTVKGDPQPMYTDVISFGMSYGGADTPTPVSIPRTVTHIVGSPVFTQYATTVMQGGSPIGMTVYAGAGSLSCTNVGSSMSCVEFAGTLPPFDTSMLHQVGGSVIVASPSLLQGGAASPTASANPINTTASAAAAAPGSSQASAETTPSSSAALETAIPTGNAAERPDIAGTLIAAAVTFGSLLTHLI